VREAVTMSVLIALASVHWFARRRGRKAIATEVTGG
jgi:hypothetical protein